MRAKRRGLHFCGMGYLTRPQRFGLLWSRSKRLGRG